MAKKKKGEDGNDGNDGNEESKSEKKRTETLRKTNNDIYADSKMQSEYDELRKDGKTDTQARQLVALRSR